jgi:hypothetical protein
MFGKSLGICESVEMFVQIGESTGVLLQENSIEPSGPTRNDLLFYLLLRGSLARILKNSPNKPVEA